jgi:hypothetical protein
MHLRVVLRVDVIPVERLLYRCVWQPPDMQDTFLLRLGVLLQAFQTGA